MAFTTPEQAINSLLNTHFEMHILDIFQKDESDYIIAHSKRKGFKVFKVRVLDRYVELYPQIKSGYFEKIPLVKRYHSRLSWLSLNYSSPFKRTFWGSILRIIIGTLGLENDYYTFGLDNLYVYEEMNNRYRLYIYTPSKTWFEDFDSVFKLRVRAQNIENGSQKREDMLAKNRK
jgi:hypothetical protein